MKNYIQYNDVFGLFVNMCITMNRLGIVNLQDTFKNYLETITRLSFNYITKILYKITTIDEIFKL